MRLDSPEWKTRPAPRLSAYLLWGLGLSACTGIGSGAGHVPDSALEDPLENPLDPANAATALYVQQPADLRGDGPATLVIPNASWLDRDLTPLAENLPTVFYDLRGRGRSPAMSKSSGLSLARDVDDLEQLRAHLGLREMSLLGWAYGGLVATGYALRHPDRVARLVLVAPLPARRKPYWKRFMRAFALRVDEAARNHIEDLQRSSAKERDPGGYCEAVVGATLRTYVTDPDCLERMQSEPCVLPNIDPDVAALHAAEILRNLGNWNWTEQLQELHVPTLIVHGSLDLIPLSSSEHYAASLPDARLLRLEGIGHMPWLEDPAGFFPEVLEFLGGEERP